MDTPQLTVKGRGAAHNPANRFDGMARPVDDEAWREPEGEPSPKTKFFTMRPRTILSSNDSPDVGLELTLNPYRGCEHGCVYCYARPTHETFGLSSGLDFETKIFVKENAPDLLRKQFQTARWRPRLVAMSGVTDCYQPVEKRLEVTRRCLKVFEEFRNPVLIITKNHLVTRDVDLLGSLARHGASGVYVSVTSLDLTVQTTMEPRTSSPEMRLDAIRALSKAGIPVGVNVAPVIPGLTDHEIPGILAAAYKAGARHAGYTPVRLPYSVKHLFEDWLGRHFPDRKEKVLNRIRSMRDGKLNDADFGTRMEGKGIYAEQMRLLFETSYRKFRFSRESMRLSTDAFRRSGRDLFDF